MEKNNNNNKNMLTWYDIKNIVPTYIINSINSEDAKKHIIGSDYLFSVRLFSILNEKTIKLFNKGALNIHSGPISKYRGRENTFYQVLHKNENIYGSLHWIDKGIDTGDLITYFNVDCKKTQLLLKLNLYLKGCELMYDFIYNPQKINVNVNKIEKGKYYKFPKDEDIKIFLKEGNLFSTFEDWIYLSKFFINSKESTNFLKKQLNEINIK